MTTTNNNFIKKPLQMMLSFDADQDLWVTWLDQGNNVIEQATFANTEEAVNTHIKAVMKGIQEGHYD